MLQSFQKIASLSLSSPPTSLNCALSLFYKSFLFLPIGFFSCCRHQSVGAMLGMPPSKSVETATPPTFTSFSPRFSLHFSFHTLTVHTLSISLERQCSAVKKEANGTRCQECTVAKQLLENAIPPPPPEPKIRVLWC